MPASGAEAVSPSPINVAIGALTAGTRATDSVSGYMFVAVKPDLFVSPEVYRREVSQRIEMIKATPRQAGIAEIRIPGERSYATRARLRRGVHGYRHACRLPQHVARAAGARRGRAGTRGPASTAWRDSGF